jgi:TonB family protein
MGRYEDAESLFQRAIAKAPQDPALHDNLAALYVRAGQPEKAEEEWKKALSINPTYGSAVIELSALYGRQGKLLDAMTVLEAAKPAVVAPPWGSKVRRNLGFAFLGAGRTERARNTFLDGVSGGSGDALTHLGLAHTRMLEGSTEAALGAFRRGAALDSTLAEPFVRAWKSTLRFALAGSDAGGSLARMIARLDASPADEPVLGGATGADATPKLVEFVLEDWSFANADLIVQQFEEAEQRITEEGYDTAPVPTTQVPAVYPEQAQDRGLEGEVLIKVSIDESGSVVDAVLERSNADRELIESALEAAMKWKFQPAVRYGSPVASTVVIPFKFTRKR